MRNRYNKLEQYVYDWVSGAVFSLFCQPESRGVGSLADRTLHDAALCPSPDVVTLPGESRMVNSHTDNNDTNCNRQQRKLDTQTVRPRYYPNQLCWRMLVLNLGLT